MVAQIAEPNLALSLNLNEPTLNLILYMELKTSFLLPKIGSVIIRNKDNKEFPLGHLLRVEKWKVLNAK